MPRTSTKNRARQFFAFSARLARVYWNIKYYVAPLRGAFFAPEQLDYAWNSRCVEWPNSLRGLKSHFGPLFYVNKSINLNVREQWARRKVQWSRKTGERKRIQIRSRAKTNDENNVPAARASRLHFRWETQATKVKRSRDIAVHSCNPRGSGQIWHGSSLARSDKADADALE